MLLNNWPIVCRVTLDLLAVEWLASWSSVFKSVGWNTSVSIERWFLLEISLERVVWTGP